MSTLVPLDDHDADRDELAEIEQVEAAAARGEALIYALLREKFGALADLVAE